MYISTLSTPIGIMLIEANDLEIYSIGFSEKVEDTVSNSLTELVKEQFLEYFDGKRYLFNFPMSQSGTDFQQAVWKELGNIEAGKPLSYASLSRKMNNPLAIRAIASANGQNKLMIAVPCHRVIGSNGDLVGFSAGLWRKRWLLDHEAQMMNIGQATLTF